MRQRLRRIIRKEFIQALRDPRMRSILFLPPLIQLLIFGYAASLDVDNAKIAWMDQDHTPESRELLSEFEGSGRFILAGIPNDERAMQRMAGMTTPRTRWLSRGAIILSTGVVATYGGFAAAETPKTDSPDQRDPAKAELDDSQILGVVTAFDLQAHPTTDVFFGTIAFPAAEATSVIQGWADYLRSAPEELTSTADLANPFAGGPAAPGCSQPVSSGHPQGRLVVGWQKSAVRAGMEPANVRRGLRTRRHPRVRGRRHPHRR